MKFYLPEKVKIIELKLGESEGDVVFKPVNKKINQTIFVPPFPLFKEKTVSYEQKLCCFLSSLELRIFKYFKEKQIIDIQLDLVDFSATKLGEKIKKIEQTRKSEFSVYTTVIFGEIIHMSEYPGEKFSNYKQVIVDCGVFVRTSVQNSQDFKKGDFIKVEGRLDARFT